MMPRRLPVKYAGPAPAMPAESSRDIALARAGSLIGNLQRCVEWLIRHGVYVIGFNGRRRENGTDEVTIRVAASPYLYKLMMDATWLKQTRDGALVTHTWQAIRFATRIEWEEVSCAG
ncbi:hypothetical protein [Azonexus sp.]|uniref:hypothetical protein n=1 Tax=Azonexus sp. TaxID=1872668 RepID=UPI0035B3C930